MENASFIEEGKLIAALKAEINKVIIGQEYMVDRILIGLLSGGHILLEGIPGLAKSLTASTIARTIGVDFKRIQFTPDLLPADILGTEIYNQKTGEFIIKKGPIFCNLLLADEINRAPAKVQSALLEAMQEKQVTIGETTYELDKPFLVIATQNPLEQQGTYPLPEAQQDRFMLKLKIKYPDKNEERNIIDRFSKEQSSEPAVNEILTRANIFELRKAVDNIYVDENIKNYVLDIIFKTREASVYISCGASPRASINLIKAAKCRAFMEGRGFVIPDDIKAMVYDVLRHRILLSYEAEAENINSENIITQILEQVNLP
ncbi:ATPase associated with various cellular activities AAA_3 [Pseudobacteroides cellulosolvens ATCC 35603 = DSM 2933]|uniref:ATPase associated with various cellular activities AAA_3 n=1 Tax=Pseudobacteroides cellulosolvens ATCC 35603 = DSM 2933 TaxID=398512 RepID=A0A0L6JS53_9FIRM|nr:ATPase associated with various cellular activities AAA_3 [Pseudobacteroides cellulosolvens ATCC 35603 = DSM 2933]